MKGAVKRLGVCLLLCLMLAGSFCGAVEFDHQVIYVGLDNPDDVVNGDINGDGLMDILCSEGNIHWFENLGGDPPEWRRSDPVAPTYPDWSGEKGYMAVWVGDFDGDRDTDIVAGAKGKVNGKDRPVLWFENLAGSGRKWKDHWLPEVLCGDHHDHSRTHDFDGDGCDEIITQKYHGGGVYYLAAVDGSRDHWKAWKIGVGRAGMSLCDVNGDGRMDVLIDNSWLENPADQARENWPVHPVPHSQKNVKNAAGDINGDGFTDFAHAEEEGNDCYVILSPNGERVTVKTDGKGLHTMRLEDFDGDADLDLLTADIHGGHAYIFENADGKGTRWTQHDLATWSREGSHNLWTADLNGDGLTDIFGKHYSNGSALEMWLNRTSQTEAGTIHNGTVWRDRSGTEIWCNGGHMIRESDTFYWVGYETRPRIGFQNIKLYSSTNLADWEFENDILRKEGPTSILGWAGRPGIVCNRATKQYILIFEADSQQWERHKVGFARCDVVDRDYELVRYVYPEGERSTGDQSVYQERDDAYLVCTLDKIIDGRRYLNQSLAIFKLTPDYLGIAEKVYEGFDNVNGDRSRNPRHHTSREASHIIKVDGVYYWFSSGLQGWRSTQTMYATADALAGPWSDLRPLPTEPASADSFNTQHDFVIPVTGTERTTYVYVGDRYSQHHEQGVGRNVFLPLVWEDGDPKLEWHAKWSIDTRTGCWSSMPTED